MCSTHAPVPQDTPIWWDSALLPVRKPQQALDVSRAPVGRLVDTLSRAQCQHERLHVSEENRQRWHQHQSTRHNGGQFLLIYGAASQADALCCPTDSGLISRMLSQQSPRHRCRSTALWNALVPPWGLPVSRHHTKMAALSNLHLGRLG